MLKALLESLDSQIETSEKEDFEKEGAGLAVVLLMGNVLIVGKLSFSDVNTESKQLVLEERAALGLDECLGMMSEVSSCQEGFSALFSN